jgi:hypothetical protein
MELISQISEQSVVLTFLEISYLVLSQEFIGQAFLWCNDSQIILLPSLSTFQLKIHCLSLCKTWFWTAQTMRRLYQSLLSSKSIFSLVI